ncbi:hypothetical protein [Demequina gelatinilytica]|uniref:hypothetical protein n=1 Tax=Demequina gelatinilytica TaxID=1638980 RepID=UPI000B30B238|nr:hypothetical protein [Demequina gelatinilytica]
MQIFPSLNHENIWTLTLPQWWAVANSVDSWRKEQKRKSRQSRTASRSRRH